MQESNFIAGKWVTGTGNKFNSINPATNQIIWEGQAAGLPQVDQAINAARQAFGPWMSLSFEQRYEYLQKFVKVLEQNSAQLSEALAQDNGKPLWDAKTEIAAMIGKLDISKKAYADRCNDLRSENKGVTTITRHKPHGVVVVIAPFNFPGHIPNGHITPALLAGNTVIVKPSELIPYISIKIMQCWEQAGLPPGVINLVQGGADVSQRLCHHPEVDGIFFTGSSSVGYKIQETLKEFPWRILALEMGGNNPLVIHNPNSIDAAVYYAIQSAYMSAGQRCTCARRLIMVKNAEHEQVLAKLIEAIKKIKVGPYTDQPEPFMGPVISNAAADRTLNEYKNIVQAGAKVLVPMQRLDANTAFLSPGLIDVTSVNKKRDEEIFGPLLSLTWVDDFTQAIAQANNTSYGLSAGLIGENREDFNRFHREVRAGIINWNRALVGASSAVPFGGIGKSGNHRPSAYYAADYCAYPVASMEEEVLQLPATLSPGISL